MTTPSNPTTKTASEKRASTARKSGPRLLQVGDIATVCIKPADRLQDAGRRKTYKIAGCDQADPKTTPPTIGCEAPVIAGLIGQPVQEYITVKIGDVRSEVSLIKIERPNRKV